MIKYYPNPHPNPNPNPNPNLTLTLPLTLPLPLHLTRKLGVSRTVDVVGSLEGGLRSAVRSYVKEKRGVVLWRDVFNRLDRFPS